MNYSENTVDYWIRIETWKDIPGFKDYQVSSFDRIKSSKRGKEVILKTFVTNGYKYLSLKRNDGKWLKIKVAVLVAMSFLGHKPDGTHKIEVDHIDNNKLNDRLVNLQLTTQRFNLSKNNKGSSKYTGAYPVGKKWIAKIKINGKSKHLGTFDTEYQAGYAYHTALQNHLIEKKYGKGYEVQIIV